MNWVPVYTGNPGFRLKDLPAGRQAAGMTNREAEFMDGNYLILT
jgi:hypothetical protein